MLGAVLDVGSPFSGRTSGICAALGPLLLLANLLVSSVAGGETMLSGALLLAVVAMGGVLRGRERRWGSVGTALTLLGCLAFACGAAVELAVSRAASARVLSDPPVALPFFVVGPTLFYVGLLVLTLGLVRNGVARRAERVGRVGERTRYRAPPTRELREDRRVDPYVGRANAWG